MSGSTEVRSEPGVGSTFTINLPVPFGAPARSDFARPALVLVSRT